MKDGPYLDRLILSAEGKTPEERTADFYRLLGTVTPGVTQIIVHLMQDDEEGRNIAGSWQQRYYEFLICTAPETASRIEELGITPVGHRELKDLRSM